MLFRSILGTFEFLGEGLQVTLSDDADGYVIADAIRIERVADVDPVRIVEPDEVTAVAEQGATSDTYEVFLWEAPTDDVTVTITPDSQVTVSPSTLVFTSENYDTPQTVTVTAVDDAISEGPHTGTITHSSSSNDPRYDGPFIPSLTVGIADNDLQVIDDGDDGFALTGDWTYYQHSGSYGGDGYLGSTDVAPNHATWSFAVQPGTYQVAASWLAYVNRDTNAPYRIYDGETELATVRVDQTQAPSETCPIYGGTWEVLGTYAITGNTVVVKLSDDEPNNTWSWIVADAVHLVRNPPEADAGGPYTVNEGGWVVLDASLTTDADQSPATLTYEWDLDGDGIFGETGENAEHGDETGIAPTFLAGDLEGPGSVEVSLRVIDNGMGIDTATATIYVNALPTADAGGPYEVVQGGTVSSTAPTRPTRSRRTTR